MANIKVSELTEATEFDDNDYTMIVQGNMNKKISKENMLSEYTKETDLIGLKSYSLSETNTGKTWIDDKPIYRKVFYVPTLPNTGSLYIDTNISNIDFIFSVYGIASTDVSLNTARPEDNTLEISAWYERQQNKIRIVTGNNKSNYSAYVILEYTKTTD